MYGLSAETKNGGCCREVAVGHDLTVIHFENLELMQTFRKTQQVTVTIVFLFYTVKMFVRV